MRLWRYSKKKHIIAKGYILTDPIAIRIRGERIVISIESADYESLPLTVATVSLSEKKTDVYFSHMAEPHNDHIKAKRYALAKHSQAMVMNISSEVSTIDGKSCFLDEAVFSSFVKLDLVWYF